jgi:3-methyladenine DNA glycosylase/8-oxoguanine DNA glycosylase
MEEYRITYEKNEFNDYNFDFALKHYNIYPWIREDHRLVRVIRLTSSKDIAVVKITYDSNRNELSAKIFVQSSINSHELNFIREHLAFCLGLSSDYSFLERITRNDGIMKAAVEVNWGIRPKRYGQIFEAVCGAICAQNVDFRRLYQMMELLSRCFGPSLTAGTDLYYAFPSPAEIAGKSIDEIRTCKVGYRAPRIKKAAQWFLVNGSDLTAELLKNLPAEEAVDKVCSIPGIGPYSAGIVLSAGAGRHDIFHLDSFTRHILSEMYFQGKAVSDSELMEFVEKRWPGYGGAIAHILTTNTHIWAERLGHKEFRRSGANV